VNASRDIRIDGFLNGTLEVNGKAVIGTTGKIEGDIKCKTIDVSGTIEGNVVASEMILLKSTALILGNIQTDKISVEPGAKFTGTCKMSGDKAASKVSETPKK
jgi:cytoskeletal protein CcmA (bactofilin family)